MPPIRLPSSSTALTLRDTGLLVRRIDLGVKPMGDGMERARLERFTLDDGYHDDDEDDDVGGNIDEQVFGFEDTNHQPITQSCKG